MDFRQAKNTRKEFRAPTGKMRGGRLQPAMATWVGQSEGGYMTQQAMVELGPIPGRLLTPVSVDMIAVAVPVQAIDALKSPGSAYAGMTDVLRQRIMNKEVLFPLEDAGVISNALDVTPKSVSGVKKVTEAVRLSYTAAVNFLRQRRYVKATTLLANNTSIAPALFAQSALDKLNGVLDPEDRVNGMVQFETGTVTSTAAFPTTNAPVANLKIGNTVSSQAIENVDGSSGGETTNVSGVFAKRTGPNDAVSPTIQAVVPAQSLPVNLSGLNLGSVSLQDFYDAQRMDELVRYMRSMVDDNAEYGEEMALRWAYGLSIDTGKTPWLLAERTIKLNASLSEATDTLGVENETMRSDLAGSVMFTVPLPKTELGYMVVTLLSVRPDETLASQPHPFLSEPIGAVNYVADELDTDPKPVTVRELYADCTAGTESNIVMYTGLNALKQNFQSYGFNRNVNPTTVEAKTAIWQAQMPLSVTPESINYPATLDHYPFADNLSTSEPITYTLVHSMVLQTPMPVGPTPVEELAILETADVFED